MIKNLLNYDFLYEIKQQEYKETFDDFFKKHEILIKYLICFSENAALNYLRVSSYWISSFDEDQCYFNFTLLSMLFVIQLETLIFQFNYSTIYIQNCKKNLQKNSKFYHINFILSLF